MGLFDGDAKAELAAKIASLEAHIEHYKDENAFLRGQVSKLQEALYAKESPVAYDQMRMDRMAAEYEDPSDQLSEQEIERRRKKMDLTRRYIQSIEEPLFSDAEDMIEKLTRIGTPGSPLTGGSLHGNDES